MNITFNRQSSVICRGNPSCLQQDNIYQDFNTRMACLIGHNQPCNAKRILNCYATRTRSYPCWSISIRRGYRVGLGNFFKKFAHFWSKIKCRVSVTMSKWRLPNTGTWSKMKSRSNIAQLWFHYHFYFIQVLEQLVGIHDCHKTCNHNCIIRLVALNYIKLNATLIHHQITSLVNGIAFFYF